MFHNKKSQIICDCLFVCSTHSEKPIVVSLHCRQYKKSFCFVFLTSAWRFTPESRFWQPVVMTTRGRSGRCRLVTLFSLALATPSGCLTVTSIPGELASKCLVFAPFLSPKRCCHVVWVWTLCGKVWGFMDFGELWLSGCL